MESRQEEYEIKHDDKSSEHGRSLSVDRAAGEGTGVGMIEEKGNELTVLQSLGLEQGTKRYIGAMETIAAGFSICLSWAGVAATLALVVAEGGFVTVLYGTILIFVVYGCIVATMAELACLYPTAGGQYHWTNILAHRSYARVVSYACGTCNAFSWIGICAGICGIIPQIVLAMAIQYNPTYVPKAWHFFLVYQAFNFLCTAMNLFVMRKAMWLYTFSLFTSIATIITIVVTCLARAKTYLPSEIVWTDFTNSSGWKSEGLVFFLGLIVPNYMYAGIDGAIHLAEECINGSTAVPRALVSTWIIGFITAFSFTTAIIYSIQDVTTVFESLFPTYELFIQAIRSPAAATVLVVAVIVLGTIACAGCYQTSSRLTWSLARDNALLASQFLGHMHPTLEVPIWAVLGNCLIVFIIGCIYLGSSTAFEAILATGVVLNLLTFSFPAAMVMVRGRSQKFLSPDRWFKVPNVLGWVCNAVTFAFPLLTLVMYSWPEFYPVTSTNMNYNCAVIAVMAFFAVINWLVWARKHYVGPKIQESL